MKIPSTYKVLYLSLLVIGCNYRADTLINRCTNFTDTIRKTTISFSEKGDTIKHFLRYYFSPAGVPIDTSNFFYTACLRPCEDKNIYRVYFQRDKVVGFCDSMLHSFPPNPNNEWDEYFNTRVVYNAIKEQAASNKNDEVVYDGELYILLERFKPFIISSITKDSPNCLIILIEDDRPGGAFKSYNFLTPLGDTVYLDGETLRQIDIKMN
ncbi:MAG TPA: hypothetical protein PLY34_21160 [Ferruginibacter sp.]|nr:hypothetical protein [Ferruginibacter sp.]HPH92153.1 hypothetical protein [Ferruginibacter sp.]